jgi:dihydrofolate synthase/folylpolyglutamate synthase
MEYQAAVDYILSFTDYEKLPGSAYTAANFDLRRMDMLLASLGNPQQAATAVHIAGTKGKGSTVAMIASVLSASGRRTAMFTSPHLHTIRERIRIDGQMIAEVELASLVDRLKPEVERINHRAQFGLLTTFEILTALAFLYFQEKAVDYQVLEVGLGGRLDATNVVKPEVCVITTIGFDHTEVLGNTLSKIAAEKAGIIKPGCLAVSSPQPTPASRVISQTCRKMRVPLIRVGHEVTWSKERADLSGQYFSVNGQAGRYQLWIPLLGDHQLENAATAVAALEALASRGTEVSPESLKQGLAQVRWPARFQILGRQPFLIVDGAHNSDSARRLRQSVELYFPQHQVILVLGTSNDKDIKAIVAELAPLCQQVMVTRARHPRAADTKLLADQFAQYGLKAKTTENVAQALLRAKQLATDNDLILVTGSLFIAAEAIEAEQSRLR